MIVVGGESGSSDLNDFWALNLESKQWHQPEVIGSESFIPKRFHTASTLSKTKVVTFGGCHSEYVHLNDLNVFDMESFLVDSSKPILCTKVVVSGNVPSTRWGHAAAVMDENKLFILGGRNDQDVSDINYFNIETQQWHQVEISHPIPKPRRRHSCIFVSNSIVMFGGFDGEFYNDINVMDLSSKSIMNKKAILESSKDKDFSRLVNSYDDHDIVFRIRGQSGMHYQQVYGNKALILYRAAEKEVEIHHKDVSQRLPVFQ